MQGEDVAVGVFLGAALAFLASLAWDHFRRP